MTAMREPSPGAPRATPTRTLLGIVLGVVALFVLVRCINLAADPPQHVGSQYVRELFAEPPAKAQEARNFALFGAWKAHPLDNYQFWRAQSPTWVYPLAGFFRSFGTDYPQLRIFSTLYTALGLVALLLLGIVGRLSRSALLFVGVVLALDPVYFHYSRAGLLEPAVTTWLALSMLALVQAEKHVAWLLLAQLAFWAAFFTKQAALLAVPVLGIGCLLMLKRSMRDAPQHERTWRGVVWAATVCFAVLAALYMTSDAYVRSVVHNINHVMLGSDSGSAYKWRGLQSVVFRLTDLSRYRHFLICAPITGPLALATVGWWLSRALRERRIDFFQLVIGAWFLCACLAMLVVAKSTLRFWTVVVPPAALVTAVGLDEARRYLRERYPRRRSHLLFIAAALLMLAVDARGLAKPLLHPTFTLRDAAARIRANIGERDATIVGFVSPGVVLGTPYKNYFVRAQFNSNAKALRGLGITHFLFRDGPDACRNVVKRIFPGLVQTLKPSLELRAHNMRMQLLPVGDALQTYRKPARKPKPKSHHK